MTQPQGRSSMARKPMTLQEAARYFVCPLDESGKLSFVYGDLNFALNWKKRVGEEAWNEALRKARTELKFGSSAVKW